MNVNAEEFSLPVAITEICAAVSPLATDKRVAVRTFTADVDEVCLDRQKFKQILLNLLSNAVKFTNAGGHVSLQSQWLPDGTLQLRVDDTGIGIAPEDLGQLFVEFQRVEHTSTRRIHGTGLGLALTKKLVEVQGGSISMASEVGKGTTVTVVRPQRNSPS